MKQLSKSQLAVYQAIKNYIEQYGYSPSIRELCEITGKRSPATIHAHLINLFDMGYIEIKKGSNRTIRIKEEI